MENETKEHRINLNLSSFDISIFLKPNNKGCKELWVSFLLSSEEMMILRSCFDIEEEET